KSYPHVCCSIRVVRNLIILFSFIVRPNVGSKLCRTKKDEAFSEVFDMKLVVKREPFTAALSAAAAIVPLRGARPSLKNALLIGDGEGNIEIQATDMEVGMRYRLKAESIQSPVSLCLPCITLSGLLKE